MKLKVCEIKKFEIKNLNKLKNLNRMKNLHKR
jgi:hypothetical protein